jgi:hypothetical protein
MTSTIRGSSHLGQYVREAREGRGLQRPEVVRLMGYRNVAKGLRRLDRLEADGDYHPQVLEKLVSVLDLDEDEVRRAVERDRRDMERAWEDWADTPVPMELVLMPMPSVCIAVPPPDDAAGDPDLAERFACQTARDKGFKACLVVSRRLSVWIDAKGTVTHRTMARPGQPNAPFMRLRGRGRPFVLAREGPEVLRQRPRF